MNRSVVRKRFLLLTGYLLVSLPFIGWGASQALKTTANSPADWVSDAFPARQRYDEFRRQFGAGDVVVLSWDGCTIDNPRLDALLRVLREAKAFRDSQDDWVFEQVTSGREVLSQQVSAESGISRETAIERLRGFLIGPDDLTTCVIVSLTSKSLPNRDFVVRLIRAAARKVCDVEYGDQHLAGPVIDGLTVDIASRDSLDGIAPISTAVILLVCWLCLRSFLAAGLVFALSLLCQAATMALMHFCGDSLSALLIVMPPLIQVLAVAAGIHLVNYYFDAVREGPADHAVERSFHMGWLPCVLSAVTTAIGMASLLVSDLLPVRQFGAYASLGVMFTAAVLLVFVPGVLLLRPLSPPAMRRRRKAAASEDSGPWSALTGLLARHHRFVSLGSLLLMAVLCPGIARMRTSVRIETLFRPDSLILRDYVWLEQHVGDLVPIEVIMRMEPECELLPADRLRLVENVERRLRAIDGVSATTSAASWLPPSAIDSDGDDSRLRRMVLNRRMQAALPTLIAARTLAVNSAGRQEWRVTARVSALAPINYADFLDIVEHRISPLLKDKSGEPLAGLSFESTGVMPLVHDIQSQLLEDLFISFMTAFGVIAVVMTVVQAGLVTGLVSMVSNVFPALLLFGALGWLGMPVDIGSVMTASVALGIAVDDTLHYLTFFRRGLGLGKSARGAVDYAYQHCGAAVIQTTLTCGAGMAVFAMADFVPTMRFAWMMVALLSAALVGDLIVLPAMLLGPAGRFFSADEDDSVPVSEDLPAETAFARPEFAGRVPSASSSPAPSIPE